jgi:gliding motility-associated-like protein
VTAEGCPGYDTLHIKVYKGPDIYVPNAFTPDGDGHNDLFRPVLAGTTELYYFNVYNRYGQLVFTTKQPGKGWDGRVNGINQPAGVFVWMVKAKDYLGKLIEKKGTVMLIR